MSRDVPYPLTEARRKLADGDLDGADDALCAALAEVRKRKAQEARQ